MLNVRNYLREKQSPLSRYSATFGELALRRQTELAVLAAKAESDLASRAKSAFLGTMSHELRTPLNAIIGFSDLIKSMKPDPDALERSADYASHISDAGRHLLEVVCDILDISKIESGTFSLNLASHSVGDLIRESVAMVEKRIADKRQDLEVRIGSPMPDLTVDGRRIKQILINLLSNAHKFTPEDGRILVVARPNIDGGATIAVVDSGIGMTHEQIEVALTPFGQVQGHLSRTQEGTGLGLPIARGLARQHGGDLYVESEPDVGTSIVLTLPPPPKNGEARVAARVGGGERSKPRKKAYSSSQEST
jgi:two-component system cell cycle sensor histidine kinase PleC